jgi:hypothetical protein
MAIRSPCVRLLISHSSVRLRARRPSCATFRPSATNDPKHSSWQAQNTGLELILVETMVQRLHGLIHVASANNRITFIMQFPLRLVF